MRRAVRVPLLLDGMEEPFQPPIVYEDEMPDGHEIKKTDPLKHSLTRPLDKMAQQEAELHSFQKRHYFNPFHPDDRRHSAWNEGWQHGWLEYKRFCDERSASLIHKIEEITHAERLDPVSPVRRRKVSASEGGAG